MEGERPTKRLSFLFAPGEPHTTNSQTAMRSFITNTKHRLAFTLLELLLVVGILSALAGGAVFLMGPAEEQARSQMSLIEMANIREALLQFHKDTGYLPKQGPFALTTDGGSVPVPAEGATWFKSPANLEQLYVNPLTGTGHALENWDPDTKRGWRGPYISSFGEGYVDIGDNLLPDGSGDPVQGTVLSSVRGVADPFVAPAQSNYFVWRLQPADTPMTQWGRPYLLIDADDDANARIIGMGANRVYESGTADDYVFYLFN